MQKAAKHWQIFQIWCPRPQLGLPLCNPRMNSLFLKSPNAGSFHGKNVGTFGRKLSSFRPLMHKLPPKLPYLQLKKHRSWRSAFVPPLWNHERIKNRDRITHVENSVAEKNIHEKCVYFELKMFYFLRPLPGENSLKPQRQQSNFIIRHTGILSNQVW